MKTVNDIVLKALGALLIIAGALKGWQLLTEPVANNSIWTWRPFMVLQVEFGLALGIWLLSGLFKKAAWLAALICFSLFSFITLYKGLSGAESCGCFGQVHVNPWITLFAIDIPSVIALLVFRPVLSLKRNRESIRTLAHEFFTPLPSIPQLTITTCLALLILGVTTPILAFNEPTKITSSYEVLEPETWVGKKLPILEYIDMGKKLEKGNWLILLYHHDCPDCAMAIPKYEQMARDFADNEDFLRIALIEVPPYVQGQVSRNSPCVLGRLADTKEWLVTTPAVISISYSIVNVAWEAKAPKTEDILFSFTGDNNDEK
ncbi:MAG: MauE/DoxX family redox-associated membrane protein [Planctomycetota bacterium]|jgi:thiol-disulfide isomerase/thioredoxin